MKKLLLFIVFYLLFSNSINAQTFQWAKAGNASSASFIVKDKTGNFYAVITGYIAKYDPIGNLIWQKPITGFGINGIDVDSIGNLYVTGNFYGTVIFGSYTLTSDPDVSNVYLAKFNPLGTIEWVARSFNTYSSAIPDAITVDKQGYPIIIGRFTDTLKLDSFVFDAPLTNQVFLAKYSPTGVCLWAKHLISDSFDGGYNGPEIKSDKAGNTYISGHFMGNAQFDSIQFSSHQFYSPLDQDIFLTKIDASGNFLWVKTLGGNSQEISGLMDVDSLGNSYISGYFSSATAYFGSYTLTTGSYSYFTTKYDHNGNCLWTKYGNANVICAANDGYYINAPGLITKYDSLGSLQWTKTVSSATNNAMVAVNTDVYLTGSYTGSVSFDTCVLSSTSNQMYIAKLSNPAPPIITNIKETESSTVFSIYPNPSGNVVTVSIQSTNPKDIFQLKVTNALSQNVYSEAIKEISGSFTKQIDLNQLPKGIYFVELQSTSVDSSEKRAEVKKIVLQ